MERGNEVNEFLHTTLSHIVVSLGNANLLLWGGFKILTKKREKKGKWGGGSGEKYDMFDKIIDYKI